MEEIRNAVNHCKDMLNATGGIYNPDNKQYVQRLIALAE